MDGLLVIVIPALAATNILHLACLLHLELWIGSDSSFVWSWLVCHLARKGMCDGAFQANMKLQS